MCRVTSIWVNNYNYSEILRALMASTAFRESEEPEMKWKIDIYERKWTWQNRQWKLIMWTDSNWQAIIFFCVFQIWWKEQNETIVVIKRE